MALLEQPGAEKLPSSRQQQSSRHQNFVLQDATGGADPDRGGAFVEAGAWPLYVGAGECVHLGDIHSRRMIALTAASLPIGDLVDIQSETFRRIRYRPWVPFARGELDRVILGLTVEDSTDLSTEAMGHRPVLHETQRE